MKAWFYRQFDADLTLDVPAEAYGGWTAVDIDPGRMALVVMHAWDTGDPDRFPGWHRAVEYLPRARAICREVFPRLLSAVRETGLSVMHVAGGGEYYRDCPGYRRAVALVESATGHATKPVDVAASASGRSSFRAVTDSAHEGLVRFRAENVFVGSHNEEDVRKGGEALDFAPEARPLDVEGVAEDGDQLGALCVDAGVNHLVYVGFALNWCLLLSPGGMAEMSRRGYLCSVIREATTAVENRETAREERCKEIALWRVALAFGFVFHLDDFIKGIRNDGTLNGERNITRVRGWIRRGEVPPDRG